MKYTKTFIFLLAAASVFGTVTSGEIDNTRITTFTSGSVISSSSVNTAVSEVVTQINDNNSNISINLANIAELLARIETLEESVTSLQPPVDYTNIRSRLTGTYRGSLYSAYPELTEEGYNLISFGLLVIANLTNGSGTLTVDGTKTSRRLTTNEIESNLSSESTSINLNPSPTGLVEFSWDEWALEGYTDKSGRSITFRLIGDSFPGGLLILHKE